MNSTSTTSSTQPAVYRTDDADDEIDLGRLFNILKLNIAWILLALLLGLVLSGLYALLATPIYQANALLQIESQNKNQILGDLQSMAGLGSGADANTATEIQILRSRLVLGATADALNLMARPVYRQPFFITRWLSDKRQEQPAIRVNQFVVPEAYRGKKFVLEFGENGSYSIQAAWGTRYEAKVSEVLTTPEGLVALVTDAKVQAGDVFVIRPASRQQAIEALSQAMGVQERGKKTNLLGFQFDDSDPRFAQDALNAIIHFYIKQNKEYSAQTASTSLVFVDQQLPKIRADLEKAENALNRYRNRNFSIDIGAESKALVESLNQIDMQLTDIRIKESEIQQLYTPDHPAYKALLDKKNVLEKAKKQILTKISGMPSTQQDIIRLRRDVDIQQAIYQQLLQRQQELSITQATSIGNLRVVDSAVTQERPIKPKKALIVALGTLASGFLAVLLILTQGMLRRGVEDAESIEQMGVPVYASVPFSEVQRKRDAVLKHLKRRGHARSNFLLAEKKPDDIAIEALRALRTSLLLKSLDARNNVLMITGATPAVGKTFISANLATVLAQSGKKVLLIDADLRKGYIHELFDQDNTAGLGDYLSHNDASLKQRSTSVPNLDFVPHGQPATNPAELLSQPKLAELLRSVSAQYDFVILDAPPALAVADASILGQHAGTILLVARYGESTLKDMEAVMARLRTSHLAIAGTVLNGILRTASNYHTYEAYTAYKKA